MNRTNNSENVHDGDLYDGTVFIWRAQRFRWSQWTLVSKLQWAAAWKANRCMLQEQDWKLPGVCSVENVPSDVIRNTRFRVISSEKWTGLKYPTRHLPQTSPDDSNVIKQKKKKLSVCSYECEMKVITAPLVRWELRSASLTFINTPCLCACIAVCWNMTQSDWGLFWDTSKQSC